MLLATLVGAVTAIVLGAVSNDELSERLNTVLRGIDDHRLAAVLVTVVLSALAIIVAGIVMWPLARLLVSLRKRR